MLEIPFRSNEIAGSLVIVDESAASVTSWTCCRLGDGLEAELKSKRFLGWRALVSFLKADSADVGGVIRAKLTLSLFVFMQDDGAGEGCRIIWASGSTRSSREWSRLSFKSSPPATSCLIATLNGCPENASSFPCWKMFTPSLREEQAGWPEASIVEPLIDRMANKEMTICKYSNWWVNI